MGLTYSRDTPGRKGVSETNVSSRVKRSALTVNFVKKILASLVATVLVSAVMVGGPVSPAFATSVTWTVTFDANSGSGSMAD